MEEEKESRRIGPLIGAIVLGIAAVLASLYLRPFRAFPEKGLLDSGPTVLVERLSSGIAFLPKAAPRPVGLIICGAARVPSEAYAYLARSAAVSGYTALILQAPLNLVQLSGSGLRGAMVAFPNVKSWVLAGHEQGGQWAAAQIAKDPARFSGLILLDALSSADLSGQRLDVLSLYTERLDGTAAGESGARGAEGKLLPAGSRFVAISGGRSSGFGEYETDSEARDKSRAAAYARYGTASRSQGAATARSSTGTEQGRSGAAGPEPAGQLPAAAQRRAVVEEVLALLDRAAHL